MSVRFIARQPEPEIGAWYPPFAAVVLCQLSGSMSDLPAENPMFVKDLMQEFQRAPADRGEQVIPNPVRGPAPPR
jgi:hypothetical protein